MRRSNRIRPGFQRTVEALLVNIWQVLAMRARVGHIRRFIDDFREYLLTAATGRPIARRVFVSHDPPVIETVSERSEASRIETITRPTAASNT